MRKNLIFVYKDLIKKRGKNLKEENYYAKNLEGKKLR